MAYYRGGHFPGPFGRTLVYYAEKQARAQEVPMGSGPNGYPTLDDWFGRLGPEARREFVEAGLRLAARHGVYDEFVDHEPVIATGPAPIRWFSGVRLTGERCFIRVVDLGDVTPGMDAAGNMFEAYTTLFSIDGGVWNEVVVDRALMELSRHPENFRDAEMRGQLSACGIDVASLRARDGGPL